MRSCLRESQRVLRRALRQLGSLLLPPYCAACDAPLPVGPVFCGACGTPHGVGPRFISSEVRVHAVGVYRAPLSTAITRMKFEGRPDLATRLAGLFDQRLTLTASGSGVVPVPLHPTRLSERGFNQAALLARALAQKSGARFLPGALERQRETAQQSLLSREERQHNMLQAFLAPRPLRGQRVILVDDVVTTGATLRACVDALRRAGAGPIQVIVLAAA